ncbi:MAG TPA: hypothetical protein VK169_21310 [Saprospiraceae bacterium]|nr:hypothetical protein [Saprospiraceae bacterium]
MEQDKYIRQIAEQHETPVDFEQLWDKLEPHVPQKKRRRPVFIWFWTIGIALVSLGLSFMFDTQKPNLMASNTEPNEVVSNNSLPKSSSNVPELTNLINEVSQPINQKGSQTLNSQNNAIVADNKIKNEAPFRINQNKKLTHQGKNILYENTISPNTQKSNVAFETKNVEAVNNKKIDFITPTPSQVHPNITNNFTSVEDEKRRNDVALFLPIISTQIFRENRFPSENIKVASKKNYNILLQVGAGLFTLQHKTQNNASVENPLFLHAEQPLEYLTAGASTDIKLSHRWYLQPGLRYSRYATRLENVFTDYISTTKQDVTEIIIDESGFASNVQGSVNGTMTTNTKSKWHSYYHSVDVPITIRYLLANTHKHKFFIDGGAIFQVWTGSEGGFLSSNGQLQKYDFASNPYRSNRLGYSGGIAWEWSLSRLGALYTGLSYDWRSMQRSEGSMNIKTSISSYRMNLGYRINF